MSDSIENFFRSDKFEWVSAARIILTISKIIVAILTVWTAFLLTIWVGVEIFEAFEFLMCQTTNIPCPKYDVVT